jgi:putative transposase
MLKRWQSGEMALRWTAAGMLEAERQFRRIIGYRDLAKLAVAIERDVAHTTPVGSPAEEADPAQRWAPVFPFAPVEAV